MRTKTVPGAFCELAGIEVSEFATPDEDIKLTGILSGTAKFWCDVIEPENATVLASYAGDYYSGKAAITVNEYGKGRVYYVGCDLDESTLKGFVKYVSDECGIKTTQLPDGVELVRRSGCMFLLNHNEAACDSGIRGKNLLTGETFDGRIEGYGAYCIEE